MSRPLSVDVTLGFGARLGTLWCSSGQVQIVGLLRFARLVALAVDMAGLGGSTGFLSSTWKGSGGIPASGTVAFGGTTTALGDTSYVCFPCVSGADCTGFSMCDLVLGSNCSRSQFAQIDLCRCSAALLSASHVVSSMNPDRSGLGVAGMHFSATFAKAAI